MTTLPPTPQEQVQFLTNVQRILAEGSFVATYKYALLLSIADLCLEKGDDSGEGLTISTQDIAEKFIQYYWPQCRPYRTSVLKQNTGKQPEVLRHLQQVAKIYEGSLGYGRKDQKHWNKLVSIVERVAKGDPLHRLQTVGGIKLTFLYVINTTGKTIYLNPGVPYSFRKFYSLIGDLVRGAWVRYIRRFNPDVFGASDDLQEFLFGSERNNLQMVGRVLLQSQKARCFYCEGPLNPESLHVDHFIPWSRYQVDLGHNFVLAHAKCNGAKSDFLAAREHLRRWLTTYEKDEGLNQQFDASGVLHDLPRSLRIAEWAYNQTFFAKGLTWLRGKDYEHLPSGWSGLIRRVES